MIELFAKIDFSLIVTQKDNDELGLRISEYILIASVNSVNNAIKSKKGKKREKERQYFEASQIAGFTTLSA